MDEALCPQYRDQTEAGLLWAGCITCPKAPVLKVWSPVQQSWEVKQNLKGRDLVANPLGFQDPGLFSSLSLLLPGHKVNPVLPHSPCHRQMGPSLEAQGSGSSDVGQEHPILQANINLFFLDK